MPQLQNPFITKIFQLAAGQSVQVDAAHFQGKFLRVHAQANSTDYLFQAYGSDPALSVDETQTPPLPATAGVLQVGDVYWLRHGIDANYVWLMRPDDGVAGLNTYTLMFATTPDAGLFVNPSPYITPTTITCDDGGTVIIYRNTGLEVPYFTLYNLNTNAPNIKSACIRINGFPADTSVPVTFTVDFYDLGGNFIYHEIFTPSIQADGSFDGYVLIGPEYAGIAAGDDVLCVIPLPLPPIIDTLMANYQSPFAGCYAWGR